LIGFLSDVFLSMQVRAPGFETVRSHCSAGPAALPQTAAADTDDTPAPSTSAD